MRQAVLSGAGIGYAFKETVEDDIAAGRLVEVLADWSDKPEHCYLYWPRSPVMRAAARALIDFAKSSPLSARANP
ncbi:MULTISPECIES: LysR substrate-binding domain-containing protein [Pseudomonadota]